MERETPQGKQGGKGVVIDDKGSHASLHFNIPYLPFISCRGSGYLCVPHSSVQGVSKMGNKYALVGLYRLCGIANYGKIMLVFPNYATFLNCALQLLWQVSSTEKCVFFYYVSLHFLFVDCREWSQAIVAVLARHFSERAVSLRSNWPA